MKNKVTNQFRRYLKTVREKSKITVRELGEAIVRNGVYISRIENGKINTIDFDTAFQMLKYINDKSYMVFGKPEDIKDPARLLHDFLVHDLGILSDEYLNQQIKEQERRKKERLEEYHQLDGKLSKLEALLEPEQEYLVDVVLELLPVVQFLAYDKEYQLEKELQGIIKKYSKEEK